MDINQINWIQLQDAYGNASHVADLLQRVVADKTPPKDSLSGPWFELWSRLYHQDSIYTASYAVAPILINAIKGESQLFATDFLMLPVSVELARSKPGAPQVPEELKEIYDRSIKEFGNIASNLLTKGISDPYMKRAAQAMQLIDEGKREEANTLINQ